MRLSPFQLLTSALFSALIAAPTLAQLQITEIMYNPKNENAWEWIEVRNTGAVDLDMDGYYIQTLNAGYSASHQPTVNSARAANTIVPAGGAAVIYDGFFAGGSPFNYDDALFREAWGLAPTVSLIAGDFFPALANAGAGVGIWSSVASVGTDATESMTNPGTFNISGFANSSANVTYDDVAPWPTNTDGFSVQWNGTADSTNGANWYKSVSGENGATTSIAVNRTGATNSINDRGSPGLVAGGTPVANKLIISEIMYNPAGAEDDWEWVEVYNNTGLTIDFGATPHYFDDNDGSRLSAPNIASGSIPQGGVAVLFNDFDLNIADLQAAWGSSINFIPVTPWDDGTFGTLGNGGDTVALWNSTASYELDIPATGGGNTGSQANAISFVNYKATATAPWPAESNGQSIFLTNLSLDQNAGASWLASTAANDPTSYNPQPLNGTILVHPGGDVASPGNFTALTPVMGINGDYNDDGTVDAADYTVWRDNDGQSVTLPNDATPGTVDSTDYTVWVTNFGMSQPPAVAAAAAVPEPATLLLLALPLVGLALRRRK